MPSIDIDWLRNNLKNKNVNKDYPVFIETGTHMGDTIIPLEKHFNELHTIEIKEEFFVNVKNKYNRSKHNEKKKINFHLGDSSKVLDKLCPKIQNNAIFFLDGHWSAGNTGKGDKDCPLYEELQCIMSHHKHNSIVIIDDCRLFGVGPNKKNEEYCKCDWEDINTQKILHLVDSRMDKYYFAPSKLHKKDRLIIYFNK